MSVLADSGLLIAALNRGDRHHRWATEHLVAARASRRPLRVPQPVVGEAFTKLRYDRRVSPRRDATIALAAFALVDDNPDVFQAVAVPPEAYGRARAILQQYGDHSFSYVDALVFDAVERDRSIRRVLTVDGADFGSFRFSRPVEIVTP